MLIIIVITITVFGKGVQESVSSGRKVVLVYVARWGAVFKENIKNVSKTDEWLHKMWHINKMEYYSAKKKKGSMRLCLQ